MRLWQIVSGVVRPRRGRAISAAPRRGSESDLLGWSPCAFDEGRCDLQSAEFMESRPWLGLVAQFCTPGLDDCALPDSHDGTNGLHATILSTPAITGAPVRRGSLVLQPTAQ